MPAPGWYVLGLLALLALVWLLLVRRQRSIAQRYRRLALDELQRLENATKDPGLRRNALAELPVLLKRTALAAWPREQVAALTGADRWRFLDRNGHAPVFTKPHGETLARLAYGQNLDLSHQDAKDLFRAVGSWIRHHQVTLLVWVALVLALARPQWLEDPLVKELPKRDMLLAVDLSGSMETEDFTDAQGVTVSRLSAVKQVLDEFPTRREDDRCGRSGCCCCSLPCSSSGRRGGTDRRSRLGDASWHPTSCPICCYGRKAKMASGNR